MGHAVSFRTLEDGGQTAEAVAAELIGFLGTAHRTLDVALYDVRLPGPIGDAVAGALRDARDRGVAVRIVYNDDERDLSKRPLPPPPRTDPPVLAAVGVPLKAIPGDPDLMHHKFVVRDGESLWCGSTNWTLDSWTREENVICTLEAPDIAAAYAQVFEQLWTRERVQGTGAFDVAPVSVGGASVGAWFSPGRGEQLSHRIAKAIGAARTRVRIASPVLTAGPILGTLAEVCAERRVDLAGVCDATQVHEVFHQWSMNERSSWKAPLLERVLADGHFTGKRSTPWAPGATHDYMHAKLTIADHVVFCGSFNLSRSGELNAENVLEIHDPTLADRLAAWIDRLRTRYPEPVVSRATHP